MSEELKEAISRGQIERYRRTEEIVDRDAVKSKVCTVCRTSKRVPEDYVMRKRKLKSGGVRTYPSGECNQCANDRKTRWKEEFIAKHGHEAWLERQRRYNSNRPSEERRRYQREYGRMRRIEEGATPRGPWKIYADESGGRLGYMMMPAKPFIDFWKTVGQVDRQRVSENLRRSVRRAEESEQENIEFSVVDAVSVALGLPGLVQELYPS
jgi:hypothetical protein